MRICLHMSALLIVSQAHLPSASQGDMFIAPQHHYRIFNPCTSPTTMIYFIPRPPSTQALSLHKAACEKQVTPTTRHTHQARVSENNLVTLSLIFFSPMFNLILNFVNMIYALIILHLWSISFFILV